MALEYDVYTGKSERIAPARVTCSVQSGSMSSSVSDARNTRGRFQTRTQHLNQLEARSRIRLAFVDKLKKFHRLKGVYLLDWDARR